MKFDDILKVRKKYASYIFELCFKNFDSPKTFVEEDLQFKRNMDYDWMLQAQFTKISSQSNELNKRIREFSKLTQVDKRILNELMSLKVQLKKQKKTIEDLKLKHYQEISKHYQETILNLCEKIFDKIKDDELLHKLQLATQKTDKRFMAYCLNWKIDKKSYHDDISEQTTFIFKTCEHLLEEIKIAIDLENSDAYKGGLAYAKNASSTKNATIAANCINLSHYVENFKKLYPETLNYKNNFLTKLELKNDFKDLANMSGIHSQKNSTEMQEKLEVIIPSIKKAQEIFYGLYDANRSYLIKLDFERRKMSKAAISEKRFLEIVLKQWLENDPDGIFYLFSEYLKDHEYFSIA
jgi:rRNA-processing protein FCF1